MSRLIQALCGSALVLSSSLNAAPTELRLAGKWGMDVDRERCAAAQTYTGAKRQAVIGYRLHPFYDSVGILVDLPGDVDRIEKRTVRIDLGGEIVERSTVISHSARPGNILHELTLTTGEMAQAIGSGRMIIRGRGLNIQVPMDGLGDRLAALRICTGKLLAKWGLPEAEQERIAQYPQLLDRESLISGDQYPAGAMSRRAIGRIEARVMISADGTASACQLVRSSGHADLDAVTCSALEKARFRPALDSAGKPMDSPYVEIIHFRLAR